MTPRQRHPPHYLPLHFRWHSSKAPGLGSRLSGSASCAEGGSTGETEGIPKPGGIVSPGAGAAASAVPVPAPAVAVAAGPPVTGGGLGELAAKTLPILGPEERGKEVPGGEMAAD